MSMTVKAHLEIPGSKPKVKKFSVASSYMFLHEKIEQVFPSLADEEFRLYWKDDDDNLMSFSDDDELMDALDSVHDKRLEIFIKPSDFGKTLSDTSDSTDEEHNAICNICDEKIYGTRFKCCICSDYDLCSTCEGRGEHSEHPMVRMTDPDLKYWRSEGGNVWHFVTE